MTQLTLVKVVLQTFNIKVWPLSFAFPVTDTYLGRLTHLHSPANMKLIKSKF